MIFWRGGGGGGGGSFLLLRKAMPSYDRRHLVVILIIIIERERGRTVWVYVYWGKGRKVGIFMDMRVKFNLNVFIYSDTVILFNGRHNFRTVKGDRHTKHKRPKSIIG